MSQVACPDRAHEIYGWCQEAFAANGRALTFPANTLLHKTYQWRYVLRLTKQIEEWGFDDDTARVFVQYAVAYLKKRHLLHKGLAIFSQSNILSQCLSELETHTSRCEDCLQGLTATKQFLDTNRIDGTIVKALLSRKRLGMPVNVVTWWEEQKLSFSYLAVSKACTFALNQLAEACPDQRGRLPTAADLFAERTRIANDPMLRSEAERILGNDWRNLCQR